MRKQAVAGKKNAWDFDILIRTKDPDLKKRIEIISKKAGHNSLSRAAEIALQVGVSVMENPAYWHARIDGVLDSTIADYVNAGLDARLNKKRGK